MLPWMETFKEVAEVAIVERASRIMLPGGERFPSLAVFGGVFWQADAVLLLAEIDRRYLWAANLGCGVGVRGKFVGIVIVVHERARAQIDIRHGASMPISAWIIRVTIQIPTIECESCTRRSR